MLQEQDKALIERHALKPFDYDMRPVTVVKADVKQLSLRDLETFREAVALQILQLESEHVGDVEVYHQREMDLKRWEKDKEDLNKLKGDLMKWIRTEKDETKREEMDSYLKEVEGFFKYYPQLERDHKADEMSKQRMMEWKHSYFLKKLHDINEEIKVKQVTSVGLAFKLFIDSLLILIHAKKKPSK